MTDTVALRNVIKNKGLKYNYIARSVGLSPYGLQKKIENENEFRASEIVKLSEVLELSVKQRNDIFFAKAVD